MEIGPIRGKGEAGFTPGQSAERLESREQPDLKKDHVHISGSSRDKLAELADKYLHDERTGSRNNDPDDERSARIARLRNRVESGYYQMDKIRNQIVERLSDAMIDEMKQDDNIE